MLIKISDTCIVNTAHMLKLQSFGPDAYGHMYFVDGTIVILDIDTYNRIVELLYYKDVTCPISISSAVD